MVDESTLKLSFLVASLFLVSLLSSWYRKDPLVNSTPVLSSHPIADRVASQLAIIPTVGFSDPILSYFTALRYIFNGPPMLKDGYQKVTVPITCLPLSEPDPIVKTRLIQDRHIPEVEGACIRS